MPLDDLTPNDDNGTPSSSARRYAQPDKQDMEEFLETTSVDWQLEEDARSNEHVYESHNAVPNNTGIVLRLYSTIDERTDKARSKGSDAIRLVIWDKNIGKPLAGKTKTLRIKTWRKNLAKKIEKLVSEWRDILNECPACGDYMVLREGQYGKFYGCRNYPTCEETVEADDE